MPFFLIFSWFTGPLSLLLLAAGPYLIFEWYNNHLDDKWLYVALGLLMLSITGRSFVLFCFKKSSEEISDKLKGNKKIIKDLNGALINLDILGHKNLSQIVFTHG